MLGSGGAAELEDPAWTQPCIYAIECALTALWASVGVRPDVVVGHSLGEIAAAQAAGVFSLEDGLRFAAARGTLMGALGAAAGPVRARRPQATVHAVPGRAPVGAVPQAQLLRGQRRLKLFFNLWTMKEALSKAHGMGLSLDVARVEIPPAMRQGAASGCFRFADLPDVAWRLHNIGTEEFAAAVAYEDVRR